MECLASLQVREAVDSLISLLDDASIFEGVTEHGMMASRALQAVQLQTAEGLADGEVPALVVERHHVVWKCADRALTAITGHSVHPDTAEEIEQESVATAWRLWREQASSDGDSATP
jgi:hypothetical protein